MKNIIVLAAALAVATSVHAREPKKKPEAPPPPPSPTYELEDPQMGEAVSEACLAAAPEVETYDSRSDVVIMRGAEGGRFFFHFKGQCNANTMMFAEKVASADGDACVKEGEALVFTTSFGDASKCEVSSINRWLDEEEIRPEDDL